MKYTRQLQLICLIGLAFSRPALAQKQICITIDDLPTISRVSRTPAAQKALTTRLLGHLTQYNVPAIGFVVGEKLMSGSKLDKNQVNLLTLWLDAGLELGNHTFAHGEYNTMSAAAYQQDIKGVDTLLRTFLMPYKQQPRYFRHPYLHRGNTVSKRDSLVQYLADNQYQEAPVSIDNADYLFSAAYDQALLRQDSALATSVGNQYVAYMMGCVHYYEAQADSLFKRPIAHILLTHANTINSVYMGDLLAALTADGYQFISLDQAVQDVAYRSSDEYIRNGGISWIHRWALTQGKKGAFFKGEPEVPAAVTALAESR
ncbi:polysaccharide deacetylase family protein [Fibrella aquatica]|jgi:peptidoglycan/xylan/chitin deacetylase (PgdA/CDA1 family)|uniref:polysaccharide deacetylase family protein n=1 Tax=Fibrella aquatica TaxID=3242487 RepID=UPI003521BB23